MKIPRSSLPSIRMNTTIPDQLPIQMGFRMPAEWEPHSATWIAWPHKRSDWPGKIVPIPWVYAEIVRLLHRHEQVHILVNDATWQQRAKVHLEKVGVDLTQVRFWKLRTDRVWTRDYGPIFLVNSKGEKAFLDWHFNAWAKYLDWKNDNAVPPKLSRTLKYPHWQPRYLNRHVVLEGGSIDVNGQGLMLTTEECLLSDIQCRNPGFTQPDYEKIFGDYLGVKKVLWLNKGIVGDDTHGHVDDLARFVNPNTIVLAVEENPHEENYPLLQENLERLRGMTDLKGRKFQIVLLPMPSPIYFDGQRLPASYANFYIANGMVLVPTFNDPKDRIALGILAELFPDREIVGIHCVDLVYGLGTLHCMTQQEPQGR
jgi:agmatine deiminase